MHVPLRLLMKPLQGRCCHWGPLARRAAVGRRLPRLQREAPPRAGRPVIVARWPGSPRFWGGLRLRRLLAPGRRPCVLGRTTQRRCASMAPRAGSRTGLGCGSCAQVRVGLGGLWAGGAGGGSNRRPGRDPMAPGGISARVAALPLRVPRGGPGQGVGPGRPRRRAMPESPAIQLGRERYCDAALQQTGTPAGGAIGIRSGPVCSSACMTRKGTKRIAVWLKPKRVGPQLDRTSAAHRRGRSRTRKRIRLRLRARARALGSCRVGGIQGFAAPPSGGHPRVGSSPTRSHKELPRLGGGRLTSALGVRSQDQPPLPEPSVADWVPRLWRGLGVLDLLGRESSRQVKYHKHPIPEVNSLSRSLPFDRRKFAPELQSLIALRSTPCRPRSAATPLPSIQQPFRLRTSRAIGARCHSRLPSVFPTRWFPCTDFRRTYSASKDSETSRARLTSHLLRLVRFRTQDTIANRIATAIDPWSHHRPATAAAAPA